MTVDSPDPFSSLDEDAALRMILEGTATETGENFFVSLVENLAKALGTEGAWVTEYFPEKRRLRGLAFLMNGEWVHNYEFDIAGTPCETVIDRSRLVHFPDRLLDLYPGDPGLREKGFVSYLGVPLLDVGGKCLGHMAVVDSRPMPEEPRAIALFQIFAERAAAELQRLRAESEVRQREEKLSRLFDSAMDAIIELDQNLHVTRINSAAEKLFECDGCHLLQQQLCQRLDDESRNKLAHLKQELDSRPKGQRYLWIPGGLTAHREDGSVFPAEATLSRFEMERQPFYTLILRNVRDRLEAEKRIRTLAAETEYLKEELEELRSDHEVIGTSAGIQALLKDVEQVGPTEASVLIYGETGTGKELVARAVHNASPRRENPLVKVNCAAIPSALMESEFFGHEKGAFTGATGQREGRFALAAGGTIFLDEVGELPIDLQAKLLRVLQEGEFEAVGSSQTRKVDVRVVAATNRDLEQAAQAGTFREDLYYRLNVFPMALPPLREREDDIVLLASTFAKRFAEKMGKNPPEISAECQRRLKSYDWPGNVRELQNVIERALITSQDGRLNLDRALPATERGDAACEGVPSENGSGQVQTMEELQQRERANIILALEQSAWRVSGQNGAAALLGINPSTLNSRMKSLGIERPR